MQQTVAATETDVLSFMRAAGEHLAAEAEVLSSVIASILHDRGCVTNEFIITYLIKELEETNDVVRLDVLRGCLEIIVYRTPDGDGF